MERLSDVNIASFKVLTTPDELRAKIPLRAKAQESVANARQAIRKVLERKDHRLIVVVGPCSIHDVKAAKDYAARLKDLAKRVEDDLLIIMRAYFEKPRTTVGWKGLINDPHLNDSFEIDEGLVIARTLLVDLAEMGLPLGTEALDPISPQYLQDTISWSAIGARTTESQTHREMASGLSVPVGFKNGTDGGISVAINAMRSATHPHHFLGINQKGQVSIVSTKGNPHCHIVLRGGSAGPNYDSVHMAIVEKEILKGKLPVNIMVDCSHANSNKDPSLQPLVLKDIGHQIREGNKSIIGVMIESNICAGSQPITADLSQLKYGVSVTDACIDWSTTENSLLELAHDLSPVLKARLS